MNEALKIKNESMRQETLYSLALTYGEIKDCDREKAIHILSDPFKKIEAWYAMALNPKVSQKNRLKAAKAIISWEGCSYLEERAILDKQQRVWYVIAMEGFFSFDDRKQAAANIIDVLERDQAYASIIAKGASHHLFDDWAMNPPLELASKIVDDDLMREVYAYFVNRICDSLCYMPTRRGGMMLIWRS